MLNGYKNNILESNTKQMEAKETEIMMYISINMYSFFLGLGNEADYQNYAQPMGWFSCNQSLYGVQLPTPRNSVPHEAKVVSTWKGSSSPCCSSPA